MRQLAAHAHEMFAFVTFLSSPTSRVWQPGRRDLSCSDFQSETTGLCRLTSKDISGIVWQLRSVGYCGGSNGFDISKLERAACLNCRDSVSIGLDKDIKCAMHHAICEDVDVEPQLAGGAEQWRVEPALPEGMELDAQTGRSHSGLHAMVGVHCCLLVCEDLW
eukprot:4095498-Amphidinium_carterae.1